MMQIEISNDCSNKVCRVCLKNYKKFVDIFLFSSEMNGQIAEIIMKCAPVKITRHDRLPGVICKSCVTELERVYEFQTRVLKTERILRRSLEIKEFWEFSNKTDSHIFPIKSEISESDDVRDSSEFDENEITKNTEINSTGLKISGGAETVWINKLIEDDSYINEFEVKEEPVLSVGMTKYTADVNFNEAGADNKFCTNLTSRNNSSECPRRTKRQLNQIKSEDEPLLSTDSTESTDNFGVTGSLLHSLLSGAKKVKQTEELNDSRGNSDCFAALNVTQHVYNFSYKEALGNKHEQFTDYYTNSDSLKTKKSLPHSEKPYQCDLCNKCFSESSTLKKHKRSHTDEKPYHCDLCNRSFVHVFHLKRHKLLHTGEKPYQCDVCNSYFTQLSSLKTHKLLHTDVKTHYQCDVCNKCFAQPTYLKKHKLLHSGEKPFKCDVCSRCFIKFHHLRRHKLLHTGDRPYQCEICNKCFSSMDLLSLHKMQHTTEQSYDCEVCNKRFTKLNYLNKHKKRHINYKLS